MPEGDSIFRAARGLHRALAGRTVSRFDSVFPRLTNRLDDQPLVGQRIDRVEARGKHLLICFSGGLILRTHMRMHGSWHVYRPGERWQRPRHDMRIVLETPDLLAVAFNVPIAEFETRDTLERTSPVGELGPDPLGDDFDADAALLRLRERSGMEIADALLDQRAMAGIGNIYKSETLFAARVHPFTPVGALADDTLRTVVTTAAKLLRANVGGTGAGATGGGQRQTTGRLDPRARFWVYKRGGQPCRRCGTPILRASQGPDARSTYWCPRCQAAPTTACPPAPDPG